jgi:hypothetical protein
MQIIQAIDALMVAFPEMPIVHVEPDHDLGQCLMGFAVG